MLQVQQPQYQHPFAHSNYNINNNNKHNNSNNKRNTAMTKAKALLFSREQKRIIADMVVSWLQSTFEIGKAGSIPKHTVFQEYLQLCERNNWPAESRAACGRLVHKAFPTIVCSRKGSRGAAKYHYEKLNYASAEKKKEEEKEASAEKERHLSTPSSPEAEPINQDTTSHRHNNTNNSGNNTINTGVDRISSQQPQMGHSDCHASQLLVASEFQKSSNNGVISTSAVSPKMNYITPFQEMVYMTDCPIALPTSSSASSLYSTDDVDELDSPFESMCMKEEDFLSSFYASTCDSARCSAEEFMEGGGFLDTIVDNYSHNVDIFVPQTSSVDNLLLKDEDTISTISRAFEDYYKNIRAVLLNNNTHNNYNINNNTHNNNYNNTLNEEELKKVLNAFWVEDFPRIYSLSEKNYALDQERKGMISLLETLKSNHVKLPTLYLSEYLGSIACRLPLLIQTHAMKQMPCEYLINQMSLWDYFSQQLFQHVHTFHQTDHYRCW